MKSFIAQKEEDLKKPAEYLFSKISKEKNLILLSGDLGAGKTTLTKYIAKLFGITSEITSPTFTIVKEYKTKNKVFKNFYHFDVYRIKEIEELDNIGFNEYLYKEDSLCIIEWADKIKDILPMEKSFDVSIKLNDDSSRKVEIGE